MTDSYLTIAEPVLAAKLEIKKSVFWARLAPVADETEAREVLAECRKEYWDARHHCSAFVLGRNSEIARSSDDGEPAGSAGMPMLAVLQGAGLTDVIGVVSRYFGGVKLGVGGLIRAYSDALSLAVSEAELRRVRRVNLCEVRVSLAQMGRLESRLRSRDWVGVHDVQYTDDGAAAQISVPPARLAELETALASWTSGAATLKTVGEDWR